MRIFGHSFDEKIANQLDFGDFRQIFLYFGLSIWTHIEYRIKISRVTLYFLLFRLNNMYTFSHKKNIQHFLKICKNAHNWSIFFARNHEHLDNKRFDNVFLQLIKDILFDLLVQWHLIHTWVFWYNFTW